MNVKSEAIWLFGKLLICAAKGKLCISVGGEIELRFVHTLVGAVANLIYKEKFGVEMNYKVSRKTHCFVILGYFSMVVEGK